MKYSFLSFLISWVFPAKEERKIFRRLCKNADERIKNKKQNRIIHKRYKKLLRKFSKEIQNRKLKVVFLSSENAKWSYQSLYEEFDKSSNFEVQILITSPKISKKENFEHINITEYLKENYDFFKKRAMNVEYAFNTQTGKYIDLKIFSPDIIFYQSPWSISEFQGIYKTSKYALACHCAYGMSITNGSFEYEMPFFKDLFRYYLDNKTIQQTLVQHGFRKEFLPVSGSSKLDTYLTKINYDKIYWKTEDRKRVIWAPHHSFSPKSILKYGTFDWNYKFFYSFMKKHPEIEFIVKPHPDLKREILRYEFLNENEIDKYFQDLQSLPNVQIITGGDYFSMFRTSDLLITDCCSFLCEYLPTLKPVIHLISRYSTGYNDFGNKIIQGYYPAYNLISLEKQLKKVLFKERDPLKSVREEILKNDIIRPQKGVSNFIKNELLEIITKGYNV